MTINKIKETNRNEVPGQGMDKNIFVKAGDFNPLVDVVNGISDTTGTLKADTITEVTSANGVAIDSVRLKDGGIQHAVAASFNMGYMADSAQQDLTWTTAGPNTAVNTSAYCTTISTTGASAGTLAAGSVNGQLKKIHCLTADDATVTVTGGSGVASIVFNATGAYVLLMNTSAGWRLIEKIGCTIS